MLKINATQTLGQLSLNLDLNLPTQGVTAIFGRSGAGKSSLINLVAGLSTPQSGIIQLNDHVLFDHQHRINLPPEHRRIGYVFQEHRLFPHYTVEKNLKYGCKRCDNAYFLQMITLLGIDHLLHRYPISLSGGEKQRVAIGRALLSEPELLLMDEPLSALDLPRKQELLNYLDKLANQLAIPILYVTHSLDEIIRLADQLILIEQGEVVAFDTVKNVWQHPSFKEWLPEQDRLSLLELPVVQRHNDYQMLELQLGGQSLLVNNHPFYQRGDKVRVSISSKSVSISLEKPPQSSIRNRLWGHIVDIQSQDAHKHIAVNVEGEVILATVSLWACHELGLKLGQAVYLQVKSVAL